MEVPKVHHKSKHKSDGRRVSNKRLENRERVIDASKNNNEEYEVEQSKSGVKVSDASDETLPKPTEFVVVVVDDNDINVESVLATEAPPSTPQESPEHQHRTVYTNEEYGDGPVAKVGENQIQKGILGYMDRQIKTHRKPQSLSDPQASPAQRSSRSRSSIEKSPRRKRSKSESRRRRERKLIAAGELEVKQANETLMRYLKQCTDVNDASLSGDLEIDQNIEERRVYRRTRSQRERRAINMNNNKLLGKIPPSDVTTALNELGDDIIPQNGEIYNPFTPVVSPTEGPPAIIDKMYIQTPRGYRSVDNSFYKCPIDPDDSDNNSIRTGVHLSCAVQKGWLHISNICHGLLGGLALAHLLFIATTKPYDWLDGGLIKNYSAFAEIYANTFYCLVIVCIVSVFDRMDIKHISLTSPGEISFKWIIIIMIYTATLILSLSAESMDERIYLTNFNFTIWEEEMESNRVLNIWNTLSVARSVGAICGWLIVGISPTYDLLYENLMEMEKYQINNN